MGIEVVPAAKLVELDVSLEGIEFDPETLVFDQLKNVAGDRYEMEVTLRGTASVRISGPHVREDTDGT